MLSFLDLVILILVVINLIYLLDVNRSTSRQILAVLRYVEYVTREDDGTERYTINEEDVSGTFIEGPSLGILAISARMKHLAGIENRITLPESGFTRDLWSSIRMYKKLTFWTLLYYYQLAVILGCVGCLLMGVAVPETIMGILKAVYIVSITACAVVTFISVFEILIAVALILWSYHILHDRDNDTVEVYHMLPTSVLPMIRYLASTVIFLASNVLMSNICGFVTAL